MEYLKLPPIKKEKILKLKHFPNNFYAVVFRLWEIVEAEKIAEVLNTSLSTILKAAKDMGLPNQKVNKNWSERGYITIIRNMWQLLPYEQLLSLLGWNEEKLATVLKEDDFLDVKLGEFKPYCEIVQPKPLDDNQKQQLLKIKETMTRDFNTFFEGAEVFDFFNEPDVDGVLTTSDGLRMIYSYCGLYLNVLDEDISISYPEALLKMYQKNGINAIWIPAVLYQLVPFTFDESYSSGWQIRQKNLIELINCAKKYGIKVYLYLNEPRCMPVSFFEKYPDLQGRKTEQYAAMCTSNEKTLKYLRDSIRTLCEAVPELGGFFVITCSENITHCKSRPEGEECKRCKDVPIQKLISDVLCAISEESKKVNPDIKTIAWTWAWDDYMTEKEIYECIDLLPEDIIIQCNSEEKKEFCVGGIKSKVDEYSMSIPGPAKLSKRIWKYAVSKGYEVCAKVQVNVTWECSTVPFLPVFDLIREHMRGLREAGIKHLMLSWTLGGYPSVNLKIASQCINDDNEENYIKLLNEEYGQYADTVKKAASIFSQAFKEYPFCMNGLYYGPQNCGPSNLLYGEKTGFDATMTCYPYDDLNAWCGIYPKDIYISQLQKLSEKWYEGILLIKDMPDECDFKQAATGCYALFYSSYLQAEFIENRDKNNYSKLRDIIAKEKENALLMYKLMQQNNLFGYEAANHYYFNKGMLAEKVINCEYLDRYFAKWETENDFN